MDPPYTRAGFFLPKKQGQPVNRLPLCGRCCVVKQSEVRRPHFFKNTKFLWLMPGNGFLIAWDDSVLAIFFDLLA